MIHQSDIIIIVNIIIIIKVPMKWKIIAAYLKVFEIKASAKKSRRFDLSEVIFKWAKRLKSA